MGFESRKYRYKNAICNSKYTCRDTGGDPHTDTITEPDTWTLQLLLLLSCSCPENTGLEGNHSHNYATSNIPGIPVYHTIKRGNSWHIPGFRWGWVPVSRAVRAGAMGFDVIPEHLGLGLYSTINVPVGVRCRCTLVCGSWLVC